MIISLFHNHTFGGNEGYIYIHTYIALINFSIIVLTLSLFFYLLNVLALVCLFPRCAFQSISIRPARVTRSFIPIKDFNASTANCSSNC